MPSACVLIGLEPDEIDVAVGTGTDSAGDAGDSSDSEGSATGSDTNNTGTAEGDPGDGDPTGPGDGDPTGPGDGDPGDGDGDNDNPCASAQEVFTGSNDVSVLDGASLLGGDCAAPGPESVYQYTAEADGVVQFAVDVADFSGAIYFLDDTCTPIADNCALIPDLIEVALTQSQTIYVVVDSDAGGGAGNLEITPIP